jgi:hypothetical protein
MAEIDDAVYLFTQEGDSTKLTRITTYKSHIKTTYLLGVLGKTGDRSTA